MRSRGQKGRSRVTSLTTGWVEGVREGTEEEEGGGLTRAFSACTTRWRRPPAAPAAAAGAMAPRWRRHLQEGGGQSRRMASVSV